MGGCGWPNSERAWDMSTEEATGVGGGAGLTEDTPAAPQEAVGVKEVEPSIKVFRFVGDVAHANVRFNCQITFLKGSFMVWVGPATSPATLANLVRSLDYVWLKILCCFFACFSVFSNGRPDHVCSLHACSLAFS